ncbi:hypothetical protein AVDCRST_MAG81-344, partial [uncultured Synechococcales cyanobacterium]
ADEYGDGISESSFADGGNPDFPRSARSLLPGSRGRVSV